MKIITTEELASVTKLDKLRMPGLASLLMEIMKLNEINKVFSNSMHIEGLPFIDAILDELNVKIEISETEIPNIPVSGPFIVVANHPFGGIEGLILLKIICKIRPEFKLMANFLLNKIPNLKDFFIPVNPFENIDSVSSIAGMKHAMLTLREGTPMGIFPAGEVSTYRTSLQKITDKKWSPIVGKMIQRTQCPVVPVYFHGNNGLLFYILSFIHPSLRTAQLPAEFLNKKGHSIKIRIGKPVKKEEYEQYHNPEHLLNFIRAKTYALGSGIEDKSFFNRKNLFKIVRKPQSIVAPQANSILIKEINDIREQYLMTTEKNYEVYACPVQKIPHIIREIGRLREITFREVGEGTQRRIDLDEFDLYYHHLFIWDKEEQKIVGSYRLGMGKEIFYSFGLKGFYLSTLFKIKKEFFPILKESIELGRSFIIKEYQNRPLSLFLLWKGILFFLLKNPEYRYLIGPVSISNNFSKFSSSLLVDFLVKNHFDPKLSEWISPRKKFRINFDKLDPALLLKDDTIKSLDSLISEIEINHNKVPVLLRQYIAINSKLIGFNVDPKFANCLDGFLIVDIHDIPEEKIRMLSKELNPPEELVKS